MNKAMRALWKKLHTWPASDLDGAMVHLFETIGQWLCVNGGSIVLGIRLKEDPSDPLLGWRAGPMHPLGQSRKYFSETQAWVATKLYLEDPYTQTMVRGAGQLRVVSTQQIKNWANSPSDVWMAQIGAQERVVVGCPVTPQVELYLVLDRFSDIGPFTEEEKALLREALQDADSIVQQYVSSYGLLHTLKPLSPRQRETLMHLLTGASEKEIAASMSISPRTLHQYVTRLYRTFEVNSRPELMAWWLNGGTLNKSHPAI